MAIKRPVRVFFGQFISDSTPYATADYADDTTYPQLLTGVLNAPNKLMHTRIPPDAGGNIETWDEYLDLHTVSIQPVKANDLITNEDASGVESDIQWKLSQSFSFLPTNRIVVEGDLLEWERKTRRLTLPDRTDVTPPIIERIPDSHGNPSYPWAKFDSKAKLQRVYATATIPGPQRTIVPSSTATIDKIRYTGGTYTEGVWNFNNVFIIGSISGAPWTTLVNLHGGFIIKNLTKSSSPFLLETVCYSAVIVGTMDPLNITGTNEIHLEVKYRSNLFPAGIANNGANMYPVNMYGPYVSWGGHDPYNNGGMQGPYIFEEGDSIELFTPNYFESAPSVLDYPVDKLSPIEYINVKFSNTNRFFAQLNLYRCDLIKNPRGSYLEADFPYQLTNVHDYTYGFEQTLLPNYDFPNHYDGNVGGWRIPLTTLNSTIAPKSVQNDAMARLCFDYEKRHRIADGVRTQTLLILNYDTHDYYKGYLTRISDSFIVGYSKRTDEKGLFELKVTEQGFFIELTVGDNSISDPTDPGAVFTPIIIPNSGGQPLITPGNPDTGSNTVGIADDLSGYDLTTDNYIYDYTTQEISPITGLIADTMTGVTTFTTTTLYRAAPDDMFGFLIKIDSPFVEFVSA